MYQCLSTSIHIRSYMCTCSCINIKHHYVMVNLLLDTFTYCTYMYMNDVRIKRCKFTCTL